MTALPANTPRLPILIAPDPRLKARAAPVDVVGDAERELMDRMLASMYAAPGVGLAAPQVGVAKRIVVADVADKDEPPRPLRLVNPEIVRASDERAVAEEGCLSLPDHFAEVERAAAVAVRYRDETGAAREIEAEGLLARCLQHEIDHLDGVLFVDRISALKRNIILRKLSKAKRYHARESA